MDYFDPAYFDGDYFDVGTSDGGRHAVGQPVFLGRIEDDAEDLAWLLPFEDF